MRDGKGVMYCTQLLLNYWKVRNFPQVWMYVFYVKLRPCAWPTTEYATCWTFIRRDSQFVSPFQPRSSEKCRSGCPTIKRTRQRGTNHGTRSKKRTHSRKYALIFLMGLVWWGQTIPTEQDKSRFWTPTLRSNPNNWAVGRESRHFCHLRRSYSKAPR